MGATHTAWHRLDPHPRILVVITCQTALVYTHNTHVHTHTHNAHHTFNTQRTPTSLDAALTGSQPTGHSRPNGLDPLGPSTRVNSPDPGEATEKQILLPRSTEHGTHGPHGNTRTLGIPSLKLRQLHGRLVITTVSARLCEAAKVGFAGAGEVPCAFDRFDIRLFDLLAGDRQRHGESVHPLTPSSPCLSAQFFHASLPMHELIAFLSGRPVRLHLRPRSPPFSLGVGQRKAKGPCIAALSLCWPSPIASKTASLAPSAVPPHHTTQSLHTTTLQHSLLQMKPYRLQCRSLDMHSQPSTPLRPLLAFHSEPASVAADRPAPRSQLMPIADATVLTGHAPPQPELARPPRTLGLSSSSGSSKLYHRCGWQAASAMRWPTMPVSTACH